MKTIRLTAPSYAAGRLAALISRTWPGAHRDVEVIDDDERGSLTTFILEVAR